MLELHHAGRLVAVGEQVQPLQQADLLPQLQVVQLQPGIALLGLLVDQLLPG